MEPSENYPSAQSPPAGGAHHIQADGPGSREDQAENQSGYRQGQPGGAAGQVGPGRTGECHGGKEKELAGGGGQENEDAEGG